MKRKNLFVLSGILAMLLILAACAGSVENNTGNLPDNNENSGPLDGQGDDMDNHNDKPDDQDGEPADDSGKDLPPAVAIKARERLAEVLGVDISEVEIISQAQAEWMDSCLGLGGPAESCLQAIVPGWRVELSVKGEAYFARTDELGESVRFENLADDEVVEVFPEEPVDESEDTDPDDPGVESPSSPPEDPGGDQLPDAVVKAQKALAARLGIGSKSVTIVSYEPAQWTDGCLGLGGPSEMCLAVMVGGWRVELSANSQTYVARTDKSGDTIRFEDQVKK